MPASRRVTSSSLPWKPPARWWVTTASPGCVLSSSTIARTMAAVLQTLGLRDDAQQR
jgi:hypothetical protein